MKRRSRQMGAALVAAALAVPLSLLSSASADAATVLNRFERHCNPICGSFHQVNGSYVPQVGSACVTYTFFWQSGYYTKPAYSPCP